MTLEERVAQLEKEVAELKGQVSAQPKHGYALSSISLLTTIDVSFQEKQLRTMLKAVEKVKKLNEQAREKL